MPNALRRSPPWPASSVTEVTSTLTAIARFSPVSSASEAARPRAPSRRGQRPPPAHRGVRGPGSTRGRCAFASLVTTTTRSSSWRVTLPLMRCSLVLGARRTSAGCRRGPGHARNRAMPAISRGLAVDGRPGLRERLADPVEVGDREVEHRSSVGHVGRLLAESEVTPAVPVETSIQPNSGIAEATPPPSTRSYQSAALRRVSHGEDALDPVPDLDSAAATAAASPSGPGPGAAFRCLRFTASPPCARPCVASEGSRRTSSSQSSRRWPARERTATGQPERHSLRAVRPGRTRATSEHGNVDRSNATFRAREACPRPWRHARSLRAGIARPRAGARPRRICLGRPPGTPTPSTSRVCARCGGRYPSRRGMRCGPPRHARSGDTGQRFVPSIWTVVTTCGSK